MKRSGPLPHLAIAHRDRLVIPSPGHAGSRWSVVDLTQDQIRAFVGPNADYYLERWYRIREFEGSRALGFNWAAFFGTVP